MSVSNQTDKVYGAGDGVTTLFSFPFKVFDPTQLTVYLINTTTGVVTGPMILNTDYTVSISSVTEGGTVTFTVAPPTGSNWFVKRVVPYTQSAVIPTEGPLPGLQISNQLDLMTMMVIQDQEAVSRCVQLAPTSLIAGVTIPDPIDGNALAWLGTNGQMQNVPITATALTSAITSTTASAAAALVSQTAAAASATGSAASATAAAASAALAATYKVPSGGIIMWSGSIASIPSGWVLCNGSNGTPDLRNMFVVGANADVGGVAKSTIQGAAAQTGGEATHTLTASEIPSHTHNTTFTGNLTAGSNVDAILPGGGPHGPFTFTTDGGTGGGGAHNNVPPFYALAFIMKT